MPSPHHQTLFAALLGLVAALPAAAQKNHLAGETSPHLLDYVDSPVDWYPWGATAFEKARSEKKPIFVSIGYHACHWCYKMNADSFSDPAIAKLLNDHFISVKVDREELPGIDKVYMAYLQATQGGGGWPLNVWLTADLIPFSVGTYFPKESDSQQPGFEKVLRHIVEQWQRFPDYIDAQSRRDFGQLRANLQDLPDPEPGAPPAATTHRLAAYERLATEFDPQNGGFGSTPKFPNSSKLAAVQLILDHEPAESFRARQCRKMIQLSLDKMAAGSIRDQIDGGFHRYSTDPAWAIPHFEKMLTDQALLIDAYLSGYERLKDPAYLDVATGIARYVDASLSAPGGGFYSSQHSDSQRAGAGSSELEEGAYYSWTADEFAAATGADNELLSYHFGIRPGGNAPIGTALNSAQRGNLLRIERPLAEVAEHFKLTSSDAAASIARGKQALLEARSARPAPPTNRQRITSTSALMISALANLFAATRDTTYLDRATRELEFIHDRCHDPDAHVLFRIFNPQQLDKPGVTEDYAFTIQACLDVYSAGFDERWLRFADELQRTQNKLFFDPIKGGFYNTRRDRDDIVIRLKSYEDEAELSPNASSILNLTRLGHLLGDDDYLQKARLSINCFRGAIDLRATLSARFLLAEAMLETPPTMVVINGARDQPQTAALTAITHEGFSRYPIVALIDPSIRGEFLAARNAHLAKFATAAATATAYVCKDYTCKEPTKDPAKLRAQLWGK